MHLRCNQGWFYKIAAGAPDTVLAQARAAAPKKEVLTSSRKFPLTIKGTREDCEKVFAKFFGPLKGSIDKATSTPNNEAETLAALALMDMLEFELGATLPLPERQPLI